MSFCYEYPRPAVTSDVVLFSYVDKEIYVLLVKRGNEPFKDEWALPGGFIQMDETAEQGALRELAEETGIENIELQQLHTFSDVDRDPRGRTISVFFYSLVNASGFDIKAGDDASEINWFNIKELPKLAFDHEDIMEYALKKFQAR